MGKNNRTLIQPNVQAPVSFYDLHALLMDGQSKSFSDFKNKKVLIVNTASDCGYTAQYEGLQNLHEKYKDQLIIIGFPSNDFGEQEKYDNAEIVQFCKKNYGVDFLLAKKASVIKQNDQHAVFRWLTDENKNGWNNQEPVWNFCKYLIDENGNLVGFFESAVEPSSQTLKLAIEK